MDNNNSDVKKFENALIIDDDHDLSMLLKAILSASIPAIHCATTLKAGKEMAGSLLPDIIFLDNNLPDGQGIHHITDIKALAPNAALIMITAVGNSRNIAIENGVDLFLEKPLTSSHINEALATVAQGSNLKV